MIMTKNSKYGYLYFIVCLVLALLIPNLSYAGLGISPATTNLNGILAGTEVSGSLFVSRSDADEEGRIEVSIDGPGAMYVKGSDIMVLERGNSRGVYDFVINTEDAPNNQNLNSIVTFALMGEGLKSGSNASPSISVDLNFSVIDEAVENFSVRQVILPHDETSKDINFSYFLINEGNIDAKPTLIEMIIYDQENEARVFRREILADELSGVSPFSDDHVIVNTDLELDIGRYKADFKFYNGDSVIFSREDYSLQITGNNQNITVVYESEPVSASDKSSDEGEKSSFSDVAIGFTILILALALIWRLIWMVLRKAKSQ
jgi:hypothetical protein